MATLTLVEKKRDEQEVEEAGEEEDEGSFYSRGSFITWRFLKFASGAARTLQLITNSFKEDVFSAKIIVINYY